MKLVLALVLALVTLFSLVGMASAGCETWWTSCQPTMDQYRPAPICYRYICYIS